MQKFIKSVQLSMSSIVSNAFSQIYDNGDKIQFSQLFKF